VTPPGLAGVNVTWDSSDPEAAEVRDSGGGIAEVAALKEGVAVITATAGGKTAFCLIRVAGGGEVPPPPAGSGGGGCSAGIWSAAPALLTLALARFVLARRKKQRTASPEKPEK
jgi:hypothetical protein